VIHSADDAHLSARTAADDGRLTPGANRRKQLEGEIMADTSNDNPQDPTQMSLGGIIADLPAVRRAKKANTLSRVHRRLIEPIESDQDNEARLSFQHTVFCQAGLPYRNPGDDVARGRDTGSAAKSSVPPGAFARRVAWFCEMGDRPAGDERRAPCLSQFVM
jgi:hypothetical protein